ncbi:Putative phage tail protein [Cohaesibacter sp. ES.047]|uniref:baseplate multidomain protein megatron n=1 Tax=Cohaesibacter sp. ES.047 TaxID=1798205 RepID=UPI000BB8754B|nr:glycoside hydrolase/phage tail family protein [Cohaesibacter sp. ES.047]SNY92808.1 Putative phage tail protein [Cohaesibacter sp. ES.047]
MTTLVLKSAGSLIGGALFGPFGALIGGALGAGVGYSIDQSLFGESRSVKGPRLSDLKVQTSTEGSPIARIYGRTRLTGELIWATDYVERVTVREQKTGASKGSSSSKATTTTYSYYANFAVGLCEGRIAHVGRIWANGKELDLRDVAYRVYLGTEEQLPDSLIEAKEGSENSPAYRGLAYVVFEELPLDAFGNRIPQLSFEVIRSVGETEANIKSMVMIPGATEFGYDTEEVSREGSEGQWLTENRHTFEGDTDFIASLDHLTALCPNLERVALVVSWFGSDLRAGECGIRPCVDASSKPTKGGSWSVAGLDRSQAKLLSLIDGRPAYGGTPSDNSVKNAIAAIKAKGLEVVLYPFVMMDIPDNNGLPDPYGNLEQSPYPWRGHITCDPATGQPETADLTASAAAQISDFYSGTAWNYRDFIRHYANLAKSAGGVDAFLIGSELVGLTTVRDETGAYPFVGHLKTLASDVRAIVGPDCKLTYGADWTEYFGHQPSNESGFVRYHLDPLWADENIDAVGIDNYMPLSDWRATGSQLDQELSDTGLELDYLKGNIAGGEGYDWYYANQEDRAQQNRTEITDGSAGKPWVFRYKDIRNWWSNEHYDRDGGFEQDVPTEWIPQSKPIWFTELGCPAVHLGPNQPNRFPDPKSAESGLPYYSSGARDDSAQRALIDAILGYWADEVGTSNPVSSEYGGPMVDPDRMFLWAWDARPFPTFPVDLDTWSDGESWHRGHWLTGRLGNAPIEGVIRNVLSDYGLDAPDIRSALPVIDGFVLDRRMSARAALESLCEGFGIAFTVRGGTLSFSSKVRRSVLSIDEDDLAEEAEKALIEKQARAWEDMSASVTMSFNDIFLDYRQSVARYEQPAARTRQDSSLSLAAISSQPIMENVAKDWLRTQTFARHSVQFSLPPSFMAIEPGDVISLSEGQIGHTYRIDEIEEGGLRHVTATLCAPRNAPQITPRVRTGKVVVPDIIIPVLESLDLPILPGMTDYPHAPYLAVYSKPWKSGFALYSGNGDRGFAYRQSIDVPAVMGELLTELPGHNSYVVDRTTTLDIELLGGDLSSVEMEALFAGANAAAVQASNGNWEVFQFQTVELFGANKWRLEGLLRGALGTEASAISGAKVGARFILLDSAIASLHVEVSQLRKDLPHRAVRSGAGLSDPSNLDVAIAVPGRGLRPLSPVHLRIRRQNSGAVSFSWIRRDRIDADSWVGSATPMSEASERYEVTILTADGVTLIRQIEVAEPQWTYSSVDQVSDNLVSLEAFTVTIAQISQKLGPGDPLSRRIDRASGMISDAA